MAVCPFRALEEAACGQLVDEGTVDTDLAQRCLPSIGRDSPFWTDITVLGPEDDGVTVL